MSSIKTICAKSFLAQEIMNPFNDNRPFQPTEYSAFKYGCKEVSKKFGFELFKSIHKELTEFLLNVKERIGSNEICFYSAPYDFVPTASDALKGYFLKHFMRSELLTGSFTHNSWIYHDCKINRVRSYEEDYGKMSIEERKSALSSDGFSFDAEFARTRINVFFDDIRITGEHEQRVVEMLKRYGLSLDNCIFVYFAQCENGTEIPHVEHYLNHALIRNTEDVLTYLVDANRELKFNTRLIKMILNTSTELTTLTKFTPQQVERIIYYSMGNRYNMVEKYSRNLRELLRLNKTN